MPSLNTSLDRFLSPYKLEDGRTIFGKIDEPDDRAAPTNQFMANRRVLLTKTNSLARSGDVVHDIAGDRYILADNGSSIIGYRNFRLIEANAQATILRRQTILDPVAKLEKSTTPLNVGTFWMAYEEMRSLKDQAFRIDEDQYHIISPVQLQENDKIQAVGFPDYQITKVKKLLGVYIAEAH